MLHSDGEKFFEPYASLKDGRQLLGERGRSALPGFAHPNGRFGQQQSFSQG